MYKGQTIYLVMPYGSFTIGPEGIKAMGYDEDGNTTVLSEPGQSEVIARLREEFGYEGHV